MKIEDYIDIEQGRTILSELKEGKKPSIGRMALGYANVLLFEMGSVESEAKFLRAVPKALDALIDLDLYDAAMYLFIVLCEDYNIELPSGLMKSVTIRTAEKSFIVELERQMRYIIEDLEPAFKAIGQ